MGLHYMCTARGCDFFDKQRDNLKRHYKAFHPKYMKEFDEIHVEPARPVEEEKGAPSSGKGAAVEVHRVCQEAEPLLERLSIDFGLDNIHRKHLLLMLIP